MDKAGSKRPNASSASKTASHTAVPKSHPRQEDCTFSAINPTNIEATAAAMGTAIPNLSDRMVPKGNPAPASVSVQLVLAHHTAKSTAHAIGIWARSNTTLGNKSRSFIAVCANATVSDGNQPPMMFNLSLRESTGSRSLYRTAFVQRDSLELIPFLVAYHLTATPIAAISKAAAIDDSAISMARSLLISVSIIAAIATAAGAARDNARNTTKKACPIPHNKAKPSLRFRSAEYSGWLTGETLKRITILFTEPSSVYCLMQISRCKPLFARDLQPFARLAQHQKIPSLLSPR